MVNDRFLAVREGEEVGLVLGDENPLGRELERGEAVAVEGHVGIADGTRQQAGAPVEHTEANAGRLDEETEASREVASHGPSGRRGICWQSEREQLRRTA